MLVTEALLPDAGNNPNLTIDREPEELRFDEKGQLGDGGVDDANRAPFLIQEAQER